MWTSDSTVLTPFGFTPPGLDWPVKRFAFIARDLNKISGPARISFAPRLGKSFPSGRGETSPPLPPVRRANVFLVSIRDARNRVVEIVTARINDKDDSIRASSSRILDRGGGSNSKRSSSLAMARQVGSGAFEIDIYRNSHPHLSLAGEDTVR